MFDALADRFDGIFHRLRSRGQLTEKDVDEICREIRLALLEADVNVRVVKGSHRPRQRTGERRRRRQEPQPRAAGHQDRAPGARSTTLGGVSGKLDMNPKPPTVVMLSGLQGSGKTTAAGKLAASPQEPGSAAYCSSVPTCSVRRRSSNSGCSASASTCRSSRRPTRVPRHRRSRRPRGSGPARQATS